MIKIVVLWKSDGWWKMLDNKLTFSLRNTVETCMVTDVETNKIVYSKKNSLHTKAYIYCIKSIFLMLSLSLAMLWQRIIDQTECCNFVCTNCWSQTVQHLMDIRSSILCSPFLKSCWSNGLIGAILILPRTCDSEMPGLNPRKSVTLLASNFTA